jgi:sulfur-oxidizing protein SoxY
VVSFHLGPRAGRAGVATRVRLADTQTVVAICELRRHVLSGSANVVVTLAACLEEI